MNQVGPKSGCIASASSDFVDDVAPYRDFLRGLKREARQIAVTAILGPATPFAVELRAPPGGGTPAQAVAHSCTYTGQINAEVADPAVRIEDFLRGFPDRSALTTICQSALSGGLVQLGELFRRSLGGPCVEAVIADTKPETAGLQADCIVEDLVGASAIEIRSCETNPSARPCWRLEADPAICTSFSNLKLVVQRDAAPDPAAITRMRCTVPAPL
jgi:hypothetical protein